MPTARVAPAMTAVARAAGTTLESKGLGLSGLGMFLLILVMVLAGGGLVLVGFVVPPLLIVGILAVIVALFLARGLFILQPNEAKVITLFGKYTGTVREAGWYWTNPFASKSTVSLRVHNFNTPQLKVNDLDGNPIEIAAVVAWRVIDTARASFDVENYQKFVHVQAETAVRYLAGKYPYDIPHSEHEATLRGSSDDVMTALRTELQHRLDLAGIEVLDARLTHLAYSSEIAGAMLQRQQAAAILAARKIIVQGAVGMVEDVITSLGQRGVLSDMTSADRAHMAAALLVVLTSDRGAQPIVSTT